MQNTQVENLIYTLASNGTLRRMARMGFIARGRGAISLDIFGDNGRHGLVYLSRTSWEVANLSELRRTACLDTIDIYKPLSQCVVVVIAPYGQNFEVTIMVVKF